MGFDLARAKEVTEREDQGRVVQIVNERGEPIEGVTMTVIGSYSTRYRRAVEARADRKFRLGRVPKPEELRAETLQMYADCVTEWTGIEDDGKPLACTPANVAKLFGLAPWVYEQVAQAVEDHAGFSAASSSN